MIELSEKQQSLTTWNNLKLRIHSSRKPRYVHEGEIWWCHVGENVGVEINGKGSFYLRPVLVFKKLSSYGFIGIPLTTQPHTMGNWYVSFHFHGKESWAVLAQLRTFGTERAFKCMGMIDDTDMRTIYNGSMALFSKNFPQSKMAEVDGENP